MKKMLFLLLITLVLSNTIFSQIKKNKDASSDVLIKRTIAILPFYNQNNIAEYDFLTETIRDGLLSKLQEKNLFSFVNFGDIKEKSTSLRLPLKDLINEKNAIKLSLTLNADIVIVGKFVVIKDKILITANAYDIMGKQSVVSTYIEGSTGVDIFSVTEQTSNEMAEKMSKSFPKVDKGVLTDLLKKMQKENEATIAKEKKERKNEEPVNNNVQYTGDRKFDLKNMTYNEKLAFQMAGISLTAAGSTILTMGIVQIFVDNFYYYPNVVKTSSPTGSSNLIDGYYTYRENSATDKAMFISAIAMMVLGAALDGVGIPLIVLANMKYGNKVTFDMKVGTNIGVSCSIKL